MPSPLKAPEGHTSWAFKESYSPKERMRKLPGRAQAPNICPPSRPPSHSRHTPHSFLLLSRRQMGRLSSTTRWQKMCPEVTSKSYTGSLFLKKTKTKKNRLSKRQAIKTSVAEDVEKRESSHTAPGGSVRWCKTLEKSLDGSWKCQTHRWPYDPTTPLQGRYPKGIKMRVHSKTGPMSGQVNPQRREADGFLTGPKVQGFFLR